MPKSISNLALLIVCLAMSFSSKAQQNELDSLQQLLNEHPTEDTIRVNLLVELAASYTTTDISASVPIIEEAMQISDRIGYKRGIGMAYNAQSTYHILKGEVELALKQSLLAKTLFESIQDNSNLTVTYSSLARIYAVSGKNEKALDIQLKNIVLVSDEPASSKKAAFYFYAGKSYQTLKQLDSAKYYFTQALEISKTCNFSTGVAIAEGSLGTIYFQLQEYSTAIDYLIRTRDFAVKTGQQANLAATCVSLSHCYAGLKNYREALRNGSRAIEIYKSQDNLKVLQDAYENQAEFHSQLGQYQQANEFLRKHGVTQDSLFSENKVKAIEELQAKYETEKKEAEIASLSQQSTIQTLELEQKNLVILIGGVVIFLVAGFVFFYQRQKALKSQQSQMELEQRFLRSQLNPHFISNALLAVQNFMLKNQSEMAASYLSKFAKLMRETLENSRQEFIPLEDEISMLTNFMEIHKMRMNDAFDFKIHLAENIDPETDTIPPMFVQPFVENAIEHGVAPAQGKGEIHLYFEKEEDYINIVVKDNGGGYTQKQSHKTDHHSLSTTIIQERMAVFNKTLKRKIQLVLGNITNDEGEILGAKVELKVPFRYI